MHYYVDGYNLIFRTQQDLESSLRQKREALISQLVKQIELLKIDTTIVFDSYYQSSEATRHHYKNLEIYYTDEKETADDSIIKWIKTRKRMNDQAKVTVVTSDLHLAWRARRELASTMSIEQYLDFLSRRYKNKIEQQQKEKITGSSSFKKKLPRLLPDPLSEKKIKSADIPKSDFEYYMEQFGGAQTLGMENEKKKSSKLEKSENAFLDPLESEFERWLRIFENDQA